MDRMHDEQTTQRFGEYTRPGCLWTRLASSVLLLSQRSAFARLSALGRAPKTPAKNGQNWPCSGPAWVRPWRKVLFRWLLVPCGTLSGRASLSVSRRGEVSFPFGSLRPGPYELKTRKINTEACDVSAKCQSHYGWRFCWRKQSPGIA